MQASTSPNSEEDIDEGPAACILVFNANDSSGASGLAADITAISSVGAHALPVVTGAYVRDTSEILDHFAFDDEAVTDQSRAILEDIPIQVFKMGFVGSPENLSTIAEIASDYSDVPFIAYMPSLSWWQDDQIELYQDAFTELVMPQTTVLVGNYNTLTRWLLPEWSQAEPPSAQDIARTATEFGASYILVTGIPLPNQFINNVLCNATAVLCEHQFERFEAVFSGAGDTLSAALAALIGSGSELIEAVGESLIYLDNCLGSGFRPGMGNVLPDRLFWAHPELDADTEESNFEISPNATRH